MVCEHCGSRVCRSISEKRCRHTGKERTVEQPKPRARRRPPEPKPELSEPVVPAPIPETQDE